MKICVNEMIVCGTLLNPGTKKYNNFMRSYMMSENYELEHVYTNPSSSKRNVFNRIRYNTLACGYTFRIRITGYNTFHFTIGYAALSNDRCIYIVIETAQNTYILPLGKPHSYYTRSNMVEYVNTCAAMYSDM